jgi:hypothetical protein
MRFITFLKQIESVDKDITAFIQWSKRQRNFSLSSNPALLCIWLNEKLNETQIIGAKKALLLYYAFDDNQIPKDYLDKQIFLQIVNSIY